MTSKERRGIVWIAPAAMTNIPEGMWVDLATGVFQLSWQYIADDAPEDASAEVLGDEEIIGAEAAIAWGRARARVVLIRLNNSSGSYFSAGEAPWGGEPMPAWPPVGAPPDGWFTPPPDSYR